MKAQLFSGENIDTLDWPLSEDGNYAHRYLLPMIREGPQKFIRNVFNTKVMIVKVENIVLPVTVTDFHPENTYTCSPYTHYISYGGLEEIRHLGNRTAVTAIKPILKIIGKYLLENDFDKVVFLNNWLLSTNLYPAITEQQLEILLGQLVEWFPDRAIIFRSLDEFQNSLIMKTLSNHNFKKVLSRQVWYQNPEVSKQKKQFKVDRSALRKSGYEICDELDFGYDDSIRMIELYRLLYLDKYSRFNPQFTPEFILKARDQGWLHLRSLRRDGQINGIMGFFIRNGLMTQPLFGYDTSLPRSDRLYQLLSHITLKEGLARGLIVHASGGVGNFKKLRGGVPVMEYNAVYHHHLPGKKQLPWIILNRISNYLIPFFQKKEF